MIAVEIERHTRTNLDKLEADLANNGWDLNKVHPYPKSYGPTYAGKADFIRKVDARVWAKQWVKDLPAIRHGDVFPEIVAFKEDGGFRTERICKEANTQADLIFASYCAKLGNKFDKQQSGGELTTVVYQGGAHPHDWSRLTFETTEVTLVFKTKIILNRSVYNKIFNQWPTRLESRKARQ